MIIGICGAHRTGKSTLAREFAKKHPPYTFVETSVSTMMKQAGIPPEVDIDIERRLAVQNIILDKLDAHYAAHQSYAVFDRTPLDAAAYMLADVQRENVPAHLQAPIVDYVQRAIEITNRRFGCLLYIPVAIPLVAEPGKAPADPAYVEHISQLILGLRSDQRMKVKHFTMPIATTDLSERIEAMKICTGRLHQVVMQDVLEHTQAGAFIH